jgi:hypothetical protein
MLPRSGSQAKSPSRTTRNYSSQAKNPKLEFPGQKFTAKVLKRKFPSKWKEASKRSKGDHTIDTQGPVRVTLGSFCRYGRSEGLVDGHILIQGVGAFAEQAIPILHGKPRKPGPPCISYISCNWRHISIDFVSYKCRISIHWHTFVWKMEPTEEAATEGRRPLCGRGSWRRPSHPRYAS